MSRLRPMAKTAALTIKQVPVGDLRPDPFNPRRISDGELENLTRSIREFGLTPNSRSRFSLPDPLADEDDEFARLLD